MKIDLGGEWTRMTHLPFVWAFWAGRPGAVDPAGVAALQEARDAGVADSDGVADRFCASAGGSARPHVCRRYLRENIKYRLRDREAAGLRGYFELAAKHGLLESAGQIEFY